MENQRTVAGQYAPGRAETPASIPDAETAEPLPAKLRRTLEMMAKTSKVPMLVWDEHANAVLGAAAEIERLERIYLSAVNGRREMRQALREARSAAISCHHEPYLGRCAHCDVPFKDGKPVGFPLSDQRAVAGDGPAVAAGSYPSDPA